MLIGRVLIGKAARKPRSCVLGCQLGIVGLSMGNAGVDKEINESAGIGCTCDDVQTRNRVLIERRRGADRSVRWGKKGALSVRLGRTSHT